MPEITEYWLISAPGDKTCQQTWESLNKRTKDSDLSNNWKFHIPDLKVGTLDQLVGLSDDLGKLDTFAETVTRKLANYLGEVLEDQKDKLHENLVANGVELSAYLSHFQWDLAKYPIKQSLRGMADMISRQITQIETDLKSKASAYNSLKGSLQAMERKQTGSLLTRNLGDLVKKEDFVLDSEYLRTLMVVVAKPYLSDWWSRYESLNAVVVPRSSKLIFEDNENALVSVTLFEKATEEFKAKARENKFMVRDFVYDEKELDAGKTELTRLATDKRKQFGPLVRWLKVNFGESFIAWIHVKALRVFVESVLRYGLPVNFQGMLLQPKKKGSAKRLREVLNNHYAHLDQSAGDSSGGDIRSQSSVEVRNLRRLVASLKRNEIGMKRKIQCLEEALLQPSVDFSAHSDEIMENLSELFHPDLASIPSLFVELSSEDHHPNGHRLSKFRIALQTLMDLLEKQKEDYDCLQTQNAELQSTLNASLAREESFRIGHLETLEKLKQESQQKLEFLESTLEEEQFRRMRYHNDVEDMKGKIRVFCRIKPLFPPEITMKDKRFKISPLGLLKLNISDHEQEVKSFSFDRVFSPLDDQKTVYDDVRSLVQSTLDGYNVCIWAYGQTGSGKTHTMIGDQMNPGIAPRAFDQIFTYIKENSQKWDHSVSASMLEIYQDKLIDLFRNEPLPRAEILKDSQGYMVVPGACVKQISAADELSKLFEEGIRSQHKGRTKMNSVSSRSHLVLSVLIESKSKLSGAKLKGKLNLIDLAGSERARKTGATGSTLKEAAFINKSLFALGEVISSLAAGSAHIPYRNSKLTTLMQDSLGGNSKTLFFINVSSAACNLDETISSLMYGTRVKMVTNAPSKNELH
ncbi:unnamed protein product [Notodromas monacha]|uniref:Kinesin-like protein n=1 Tax=Notodromas monacha TaxID=399045 RepID=A0A7R9BPU0_9CRUS|nr:unnamed protein product [Notodromas monacha]CAG0918094.1 unnamed protein product [Notodromas monacha]